MNKYIIGSNLLGLTNNKDNDYLIITEEGNINLIKFENEQDNHYRSVDNIKKSMSFDEELSDNIKLYNYQLDKEIIGQDFPIDYHILEYKEQLIELLKRYVNYKKLNFNRRVYGKNKTCLKAMYHIAYNLFIIENNSPIITSEQKAIIQKIHDGEMSKEYAYELEERILNL